MEHSEVTVKEILKKDGVENIELEKYNKSIVGIKDIIDEKNKIGESWSHCVVNSESNSATLICQYYGEGNRRHYHSDWNEWWYIIMGEWEFEIEGELFLVKQNDLVFIPKNKWHKIKAISKDGPSIRLAVSRYDVAHIYKDEDEIRD